jgi:hypothetical protein
LSERWLIVPQEAATVQPLLQLLRQGDWDLDEAADFATALKNATAALPAGVVAECGPQSPGLLELVVALDAVQPGVPFLVVSSNGTVRDLPIEPSRSIVWQSAARRPRDLLTSLRSLAASPRAAEAFRRGADYLLAAILCQRSIGLDLLANEGKEAHVEIVGGDVWNAYGEDGGMAMDALEAILYEPIRQATVRALHHIPGERQIRLHGVQALGPASRRPPERKTAPVPTLSLPPRVEIHEFGTQDVEIVPLEEVADDRFDHLLEEGIKASLARDYARAVRAFEDALTLKPGNTKAEFNLARVRSKLKG